MIDGVNFKISLTTWGRVLLAERWIESTTTKGTRLITADGFQYKFRPVTKDCTAQTISEYQALSQEMESIESVSDIEE